LAVPVTTRHKLLFLSSGVKVSTLLLLLSTAKLPNVTGRESDFYKFPAEQNTMKREHVNAHPS